MYSALNTIWPRVDLIVLIAFYKGDKTKELKAIYKAEGLYNLG